MKNGCETKERGEKESCPRVNCLDNHFKEMRVYLFFYDYDLKTIFPFSNFPIFLIRLINIDFTRKFSILLMLKKKRETKH